MITYLTFFPKDVPSGKLWNAWKTTIFQCGKSSLKWSTDSDWALASTANCNKYLEGNQPKAQDRDSTTISMPRVERNSQLKPQTNQIGLILYTIYKIIIIH